MSHVTEAAASSSAKPRIDPLLEPFQLKHLRLRNRIISTSHSISYGVDGKPMQRYQLYHEEKAKGGIALTMFGGASNVAADSGSVFGQLYVGDDTIIPYFREFADRVHRHGAALMCQLTHLGGRTHWRADNWLPVIAPSRFREPLHRAISKEMDEHDIGRVVQAFAAAARRCQESGLDGIEVLAHGHLVGQFWSRHTNRRTDAFGGSLENRCRFSVRVLEAIRGAVGDRFIVGLRMPIDENFDDGLSEAECREIAQLHEERGLVDFFNLNHGRIDTAWGLATFMPGMAGGLAPFLEKVGRFRRHLKRPVIHACRITDLATARHAVRDGLIDLVGMTRAHIADPHIVHKLEAGQEERIRPCVGATYCSTYRLCIHNPATGREATIPQVIAKATGRPRKIVVVGAGPAGLEAARVCGERGHKVVLFEAADRVGGQVVLAAKVPSRRDLVGIIDWRKSEIERLGVRLRLNAYAEAADVLAEEPDDVVIATGGVPDIDHEEGAEHCVSVWDVLAGSVAVGGEALIYDGTGDHSALSCAQALAQQGTRIDFVSRDEYPGQDVGYLERPFFLKTLYERSFTVSVLTRLVRVESIGNRKRVVLCHELSEREEERICDTVIVERGTRPNDKLYGELRPLSRNDGVVDIEALVASRVQDVQINPAGKFRLMRVGDAVAARDIHAAIFDSLRLCKEL